MAKTKHPTALLFDLDGTIVDTIELIMSSMEFAFSEYEGPRPTREEWLEGLGIPLRTQLAARARSIDELDWMIAKYRLHQGEHHDRLTVLYPGMADVLRELHRRGHPMGIVTSKLHGGAVKALAHVECIDYFDVIVAGDTLERAKPDPDPVLYALKELGVSPGNAVMIGDSPHDMRAGRAAGTRTAAVLWGPFTRAQLGSSEPDIWLERVESLLNEECVRVPGSHEC